LVPSRSMPPATIPPPGHLKETDSAGGRNVSLRKVSLRCDERYLIVDFVEGIFCALLNRFVLSIPDAASGIRLACRISEYRGDSQASIAAERKRTHIIAVAGT